MKSPAGNSGAFLLYYGKKKMLNLIIASFTKRGEN
jgi:hypothetical protein